MNRIRTRKLEDNRVNIRVKLSGLWGTLMVLFLYADLFSLYRPGYISEVMEGYMGPLTVDQGTLVASSLLMAIPALMILASLFMKPTHTRWVNIGIGILYLFVCLGNLLGETWAYYMIYGVIEAGITAAVIATAFKWPKKQESMPQ